MNYATIAISSRWAYNTLTKGICVDGLFELIVERKVNTLWCIYDVLKHFDTILGFFMILFLFVELVFRKNTIVYRSVFLCVIKKLELITFWKGIVSRLWFWRDFMNIQISSQSFCVIIQ